MREQKKAKWVYYECVCTGDGPVSGYACSNCKAFVEDDIFEQLDHMTAYCGACGAKMKGD